MGRGESSPAWFLVEGSAEKKDEGVRGNQKEQCTRGESQDLGSPNHKVDDAANGLERKRQQQPQPNPTALARHLPKPRHCFSNPTPRMIDTGNHVSRNQRNHQPNKDRLDRKVMVHKRRCKGKKNRSGCEGCCKSDFSFFRSAPEGSEFSTAETKRAENAGPKPAITLTRETTERSVPPISGAAYQLVQEMRKAKKKNAAVGWL